MTDAQESRLIDSLLDFMDVITHDGNATRQDKSSYLKAAQLLSGMKAKDASVALARREAARG